MSEIPPHNEDRKRPGVEREYRTDEIIVFWEPALCIHSARCLRGLPQVFDANRRPWVTVDAASADEIANVITRCPSGALRFQRLDDGEQEKVSEVTQVRASPNGPLYLRGRLVITSEDGVVHELPRATLCRCGHSANKPFCDNTHLRIGFDSSI
jgi:uncharacterized Fe-S cluster protein YjdI